MTDVGLAPIPPGEWRVDIETRGRSGTLRYREGDQCIGFDWEFGSGDVVAVIRGPDPDAWDSSHPWAAGRRAEITKRVAAEAIRRKAPTCIPDIDERTGITHLVSA
jgi:hypothetical protein